jgi:uncharacterized phage protein gp47/JayE
VLEARFPGLDARSPTAAGVLARTVGKSVYELWLEQRRLAEELLPDTAEDWLERHVSLRGMSRIPASAATGIVRLTGTAGIPVPSAIALRGPSGAQYSTTTGGTIDGGGVLDVEVLAADAGTAGNAAAGVVLDLVSPVPGLSPQVATVQAPGLTGGRATETDDALRARLLALIREPPRGGAASDYEAWALEAGGIGYVAVQPNGMGPGTVGVVVALEGPAEAEAGDLARVEALIEDRRPVTASVYVLAAALLPVPLTIALTPDTVQVRSAVQAALQIFFRREARIGGLMPLSRISEAISSAGGEYSHEILSPAGAVTPEAAELPVLGPVSWSL